MHSNTIALLAEDDRPREKLISRGGSALTDAELLAIVIGSGIPGENAMQLATRMLHDQQFSWFEMGRLTIRQLTDYRGIGRAKAIQISACLEIARRRHQAAPLDFLTVNSSIDAYEACRHQMEDLHVEQLRALLMNRRNQITRQVILTSGSQSGTIADPKLVFQAALEHRASSIILVHNHPSGNVNPSEADLAVTKKIASSGDMLDLPLLDHLILGHGQYYSFADEGKL